MLFMPKYGNLDQTPQKLKILKNYFMTVISLVILFQRALNCDQVIILTQDIDIFPIFDPLSPLCSTSRQIWHCHSFKWRFKVSVVIPIRFLIAQWILLNILCVFVD